MTRDKAPSSTPHPRDLLGLWTRSLLAWPDGTRDVTTDVAWLQGPSRYVDLRQPPTDFVFEGVRALRELDARQVEALAMQEGFAGRLLAHADCFEWTRLIDFQPRPGLADRGTLEDRGTVMVECGLDIEYVEHWHHDAAPTEPAAALVLRDDESGCLGLVVRVGARFMVARERPTRLPERGRLLDHVRAASSLRAAQDLVDCELSFGGVSTCWTITRSSLPFRVGADLAPRLSGTSLVTRDLGPYGDAYERTWSILASEGDLACFSSAADAVATSGEP